MHSESELGQVADFIIPLLDEHTVVVLSGDLGAGKTTLVRTICRRLGVIDHVSSPTFSIISTYLLEDGRSVHHMDLYRIESPDELVHIGIDDYLHSGEISFIEWPEMITPFLPENTLQVRLEHLDDQCRKIVIL